MSGLPLASDKINALSGIRFYAKKNININIKYNIKSPQNIYYHYYY